MSLRNLLAIAFFALLTTAAYSADPIKVGVLLPTTGSDVLQGKQQIDAIELALREAGGKVADRPVVLVHEDDASNPNVGLQKARKLISSDNVDVMTGFFNSGVALAVAQLTSSQRVPIVIANAAADGLTGEKCSPWVFRLSFANSQVADPFGPWLVKRGIKKVFVLGADFVTPRELARSFKESFQAAGGQIVGEAFSPFRQTNDFGPYLSQARATNPDAIYAIYYGAEAILFIKQYAAFGLKDKIPMVNTLGTTSPALWPAVGDDVLGAITALNYIPELESADNKAFQKAYQDAFWNARIGIRSDGVRLDAVYPRGSAEGEWKDRRQGGACQGVRAGRADRSPRPHDYRSQDQSRGPEYLYRADGEGRRQAPFQATGYHPSGRAGCR